MPSTTRAGAASRPSRRITVQIYSGTPTLGTGDALASGATWRGAVAGLPPGTPVEVVVKKNNREVQRTPLVVDGHAPFTVDGAGSQPGDTYRFEAWGDAPPGGAARLIAAEEASVESGPPATVVLTREGSEPLVNGATKIRVVALVSDADGFPVVGATVSLRAIEWIGGDPDTPHTDGPEVTNMHGRAYFYVRSPVVGDAELVADAGGAESEPLVLDYQAPTLALSADVTTLDVTAGGKARVTLETGVRNGGTVEWTVSHAAPGRRTAYSTRIGYTGSTSLDVVADGAPVGDVYVSARYGNEWAYTTLRFESSAPLSVELRQRVLMGDLAGPAREASADGSVPYTYETYYEPVDDAGVRGPRTVFHRGDVQLFAATEAVVRGAPNTPYVVALDDAADDALITLDGLAADGTVTTDSTGLARVWLRSTGAFVPPGDAVFRRVALTVRGVPPPPAVAARQAGALPDDPPSWTEYVYLAPAEPVSMMFDFMRGTIGFDPNSAWGIAGAFAGSMVGSADAGALVKNTYRAFTGGDVNELEVALSVTGLATEVFVGIGETVDAPISAVRAIVAFTGNTPFSRILVWMLKTGLRNGRDLKQIGAFALRMVRRPGLLTAGTRVFTSNPLLEQAVRATDRFESFADAVDELATSCVRASGGRALVFDGDAVLSGRAADGPSGPRGPPAVAGAGDEVCGINERALSELTGLFGAPTRSAVPPSLFDALETLEKADPAAATALLKRLTHVTTVGKIPKEALKPLFEADIFSPSIKLFNSSRKIPTAYTPEDLIQDLGDVADKLEDSDVARHGLLALVHRIAARGQQHGFRYELEVAAHLARRATSRIVLVSRPVPGLHGGYSDIDVLVDGVAYQAKVSSKAYQTRRGGLAAGVREYARILSEAKLGYTDLVYVSPVWDPVHKIGIAPRSENLLSKVAADLTDDFGIYVSIEKIPFK